jgi:Haem-NO-binding
MYGIINKAIKGCVLEHASIEAWEYITSRAPVAVNADLMEQPYDDDITLYLAQELSEYVKQPVDFILYNFGKCVIKLTHEQFPGIMDHRGTNLKEYLVNLPNFHNRIMLIYPELTPPEFKVSAVTEHSLQLHYYTKTPNMKEFVRGYLEELASIFQSKGTIEHEYSNESDNFEEVFTIRL